MNSHAINKLLNLHNYDILGVYLYYSMHNNNYYDDRNTGNADSRKYILLGLMPRLLKKRPCGGGGLHVGVHVRPMAYAWDFPRG